MTRIRGKDGLSYGVGSQLSGDPFQPAGSFMAYAIHAPENGAKLQQAFNEEIARVLNEDFSKEEIEMAKSGYLQSRAVARAQDNELASYITHWDFVGRTLEWDAKFEEKIAALDAARIRAAFRKHLDPAKLSVIKAGDFAKQAAK
jgi:zinc protease